MGIFRIEEVHYGVEDVSECVRFFEDFGLPQEQPAGDVSVFSTPAGQQLYLHPLDDPTLPPALEEGSTIREMIWGVDTPQELERLVTAVSADREVVRGEDGSVRFVDESGFGIGLRVGQRSEEALSHRAANATGKVERWNEVISRYGRANPFRMCHVALWIRFDGWEQAVAFYTDRLGFRVTDQLLDMGSFMQAPGDDDQHTLLLGHRADRLGINHVAFEVANFDQVVEGGNYMVASGWKESRRLGRHTIGSNVFRFLQAPCGGRVEYAADMDRADDSYGPNIYEQRPPHHLWMLTTNGQKEEL